MNYYVEIRPTVQRRGSPRLVPLADVGNYTGFRSVCCYSEELAERIRERGSMLELRGEPVYADTLFMDFDGHDPADFRSWLASSGLAYQEFESGNRSVHFHVTMAPVFGPWIPDAMKRWTRQHAPTADISFLHPAGQYRLPGTYHWKQPGRRKELIAQGGHLELKLEAPTTDKGYMPIVAADSTPEDFYGMLMVRKGEGHRRPWLWQAATVGAEAGLGFDAVLAGLGAWNAQMCEPAHDSDTVRKQCESAFRRLAHNGGMP